MLDEGKIRELSKEVLLSPQEVEMWCDHLQQVNENRVSGAKKRAQNAAAKRGNKKAAAQVASKNRDEPRTDAQLESNEGDICFECEKENPPETQDDNDDDDIMWICCDGCNNWCHAICSSILETDLSHLEIGYVLLAVKVGTCNEYTMLDNYRNKIKISH